MRAPLIIGGGPAGAAAACLIARAGQPVTLLERHAGPVDKVCGDFLSAEAIDMLDRLGVDLPALQPAPIATVRLIHRHRIAQAALPFAALGLSRRALDEAVLQRAAALGATVLRGHAVRGLYAGPDGMVARCDPPAEFASDAVFLATGKHDLRGAARPVRAGGPIGWKTYYDLAPDQQQALRGAVELVLLRDGYAGLQCVEHGRAVLCVMMRAERVRGVGGTWDAVLAGLIDEAPHLRLRLHGAQARLSRPLAVAGIPYGHLQPASPSGPELFRLGDQGCVIPSLTGDGVAIALHSAELAVAAWQDGRGAAGYHRALQRLRPQMRAASLIHLLCRSSQLQPLIAAAARAWPAVLTLAAAATRIPVADRQGIDG